MNAGCIKARYNSSMPRVGSLVLELTAKIINVPRHDAPIPKKSWVLILSPRKKGAIKMLLIRATVPNGATRIAGANPTNHIRRDPIINTVCDKISNLAQNHQNQTKPPDF